METGEEVEVQLYTLNWALDGGEWVAPLSGRFTPAERALGTCCTEGWVSLRSGQKAVGG